MRYITYKHQTPLNLLKYLMAEEFSAVASLYPFRISPHFAALIRKPQDSIWLQCIPDLRELDDDQNSDPLSETALSPVPGLIHRYPDRVVLLVSNQCPVYCRFCMRKRHIGKGEETPLSRESLDQAIAYIAATPLISDVILSGGDPLMLEDASLEYILSQLRTIRHVRIIRIASRIPVTMPERVTPELCNILKQFHPLYLNTHFNHPAEINDASANACGLLADAGIPLGNQTVLLAGVNDNVLTMRELMTGLLDIRVKPYYIHQADLVRGTSHFRTSVEKGLEIIRGLRGFISGMAVPHYVLDLPEGKGKVPILPDGVERVGEMLILKNYLGERIIYRDPL